MNKVDIKTNSRVEFKDITVRINNIVQASGVTSGVCYIFVPHTTAGVMVNEHADPNVVEDIAAQLDKMVPQHENFEDGKLVLGTWQGIFFCEFDGPRNRDVMVKIVSD